MAIIFLDPGGDAVQVPGYFNADYNATGLITFDPTVQFAGLGSWKFDSDSGLDVPARVAGILGLANRPSLYFRYDSVPDTEGAADEFPAPVEAYSGGGFDDGGGAMGADDEDYSNATPAKNAGQGTVFGSFGFDGSIPIGAIIDSVKIIYERKYDINTSIGISRVKWRVDGIEGPDYDNTDQPLTDTVVIVDVSADRGWERQDLLDTVFEVIVEARRGDSDTEHTQSFDYVMVEVVYHTAVNIVDVQTVTGDTGFALAIIPKGSGVVIRVTDGGANSFDGITELLPNTFNRISFPFNMNGDTDELDVNVYINSIQELSLSGLSTGTLSNFQNLRYGWLTSPGAGCNCWFTQFYIDDADDLTDTGNKLSTAKRGASVNADNFDTTGGTGAVDERPVNLSNYRHHAASGAVNQNYTLEAPEDGDVDLTGKTIVGYMGWAIVKKSGLGGSFFFTVNGSNSAISPATAPALVKLGVTDANYPDDPAGIGMVSSTGSQDTFLYECGVIVAYEGPAENAPLLEFQLLAEDSVTPASDDVSGEDPETYVIRSEVGPAPGATITTTIFSTREGGAPRQQAVIESTGGEEVGRVVIAPGQEVSVSVEVLEADAEVGLARTLIVD